MYPQKLIITSDLTKNSDLEDKPVHYLISVAYLSNIFFTRFQRPSARVAANVLHISLWGKRVLASLDRARMDKMMDWLLCQSAVVLLKSRGPSGSSVETELQRSFLANIDLEDVRTAVSFLMNGQEQWQSPLMHYPELQCVCVFTVETSTADYKVSDHFISKLFLSFLSVDCESTLTLMPIYH